MQLTKHFTLEELNPHGATLAPSVITSLSHLAMFLEFVRFAFNKPIIVTSGFRSKEVNDQCGGKPNSLHLLGKAVDITCQNPADFDRLCFCVERGRLCPSFYTEHSKKRLYIHIQFGERTPEPLNLHPFVPFNLY